MSLSGRTASSLPTCAKRKRQFRLAIFRTDRGLGDEISIKRLQIGIRRLCEMGVGKRRIKMASVAVNTFAHGTLEGGIRPRPDSGINIRRDVCSVDLTERRLNGEPASIRNAVFCRVADSAIAKCGKLLAALDRRL